MFECVLVANRGEIAVRVISTLHRMGIRAVTVFTHMDRDSLHVAVADEAVDIGAATAYLDVDRIVAAAVSAGAGALHPGYGFLSENPVLARRCGEAGIVFVGPPPAAIEAMGDKINAKRTVAAAGVPVVPGRDEAGLSDAELEAAALEIGLPVLLKPSAGGGGKGMRLVTEPADLLTSITESRREATGAFGESTILVERYIPRPRHIEVQVFADSHGGVVSLGERECSLQRRHQKIVEEAPSPLLDAPTREAMGASAVAAARACGYVGAGTVEFIVPGASPDQYFFMEMNTRLQVEHPVTESVLGLDLVEWQLRVAGGERLPWPDQKSVPSPNGHAVEARVYAEDASRGFLPATGTVLSMHEPRDLEHVRVDSALRTGTVVGTQYDPMLAKIVAWGPDRVASLRRLNQALASTAILGVTTNVGFLARLVSHPAVVAGDIDTNLVERIAPDLEIDPAPPAVLGAAALLDQLIGMASRPAGDPWSADGWRLAGPAPRTTRWHAGGTDHETTIDGFDVVVDGKEPVPAGARLAGLGRLHLEWGGATSTYEWVLDGDTCWLSAAGDTWSPRVQRETIDRAGPAAPTDGRVTSPMPGTVLDVYVAAGDSVTAGQPLVTVGAMKMEHVVASAVDGTVGSILVRSGDSVALDQVLAVIDRDGAG